MAAAAVFSQVPKNTRMKKLRYDRHSRLLSVEVTLPRLPWRGACVTAEEVKCEPARCPGSMGSPLPAVPGVRSLSITVTPPRLCRLLLFFFLLFAGSPPLRSFSALLSLVDILSNLQTEAQPRELLRHEKNKHHCVRQNHAINHNHCRPCEIFNMGISWAVAVH